MSAATPAIVLGGTGYVAGELLRLMAGHPALEVTAILSDSQPGAKVSGAFAHLRSAYPDLKIIVGRWATPTLADDTPESLLHAGADYIDSTLTETREHLCKAGLNTPRTTFSKAA